MKTATITRKGKGAKPDARTGEILKALRDARKEAVKSARLHRVPIVYLRDGKLVREHP
jgi:hypothetical protein